jgi:3-dehydroquinate synthase
MTHLSCSFGSEIFIGHELDLASLIQQALPKQCRQIAIITDANLAKLYDASLSEIMEKIGLEHALIPFPAGESYKTRKTKERIEDLLLYNGFGKDTAIIGFGGGIVTDLAGFVASTFTRGVPFLAIPTTLMAMVDAAIGGKVAVNTPHAKNIIGTFYPAKSVFIDTRYLTTLPEKELLNGLSEVYKYGFIASPILLEMVASKPISFLDLIGICCAIKKEIVETDFAEQGLRRVLNFGHTIGHALETASQYTFPHGFAVAAGMQIESWLSFALGHLSKAEFEKIQESLNHFPSSPSFPPKKILETLLYDKKTSFTKPRFVLLEKIGSPLSFEGEFCQTVPEELIEQAINTYAHRASV